MTVLQSTHTLWEALLIARKVVYVWEGAHVFNLTIHIETDHLHYIYILRFPLHLQN